MKIGKFFRHFFATFFANVGEEFGLNFALRAFCTRLLVGKASTIATQRHAQLLPPQYHLLSLFGHAYGPLGVRPKLKPCETREVGGPQSGVSG